MSICQHWKAKEGLKEDCRICVVKEIKNCGNCEYWDDVKANCKGGDKNGYEQLQDDL